MGLKIITKIFPKNLCASILGDFLKIPKITKNGGFGDFQIPGGKKWWASLALGQSIIAKKFFGNFWAIAKANFPEIPFPPPGGNKFPGGSKK